MPSYIKLCLVCLGQFHTNKIGAMYCSKKCCNKARSLPAKIIQAMLEKTNRAVQVEETLPKAVKDFLKKYQSMYPKDNLSSTGDRPEAVLLNAQDEAAVNDVAQRAIRKKEIELLEEKMKSDEEIHPSNKQEPQEKQTKTLTVHIGGIKEEVEADPEMLDFNLEDNRKASLKNIKDSLTPIGDYDISENAKYINTEEFPVVGTNGKNSNKNGHKIRRLGE